MTLDEAIKHCLEAAENCEEQAKQCDSDDRYERHVMHENAKCAAYHRQLVEWLTELKELSLQIAAPKLGSIEEYHYELAKCKTAFWSCNKRCMDAEEQYRRKADELRKAQEQIAEYKRLLKVAVEDFNVLGIELDSNCELCGFRLGCEECPLHRAGINCRCWNHQDEALALIGGAE